MNAPTTGLLTDDELAVLKQLGSTYNALTGIVAHGATRGNDLGEIAAHIHALQHWVMAQAAARAYPNRFRLAGASFRDRKS